MRLPITCHRALFFGAAFALAAGASAQVGRLGQSRVPKGKPFISHTAPMPREVTTKVVRGDKGRAVIPSQTRDLTPNTPLVRDTLPYWSRDEQFVVFTSNRSDLPGTTAGSLTHIYRVNLNGANLRALTGPLSTTGTGATSNQSDAALNFTSSSVVYVDTTAAGAVELVELNLVNGVSKALTKNNPNGFTFVGLNSPEYGFAIGGNVGVIFAGQTTVGGPFKLYTVDVQSGQITQLTTGTSDDKNPTLSPNSLEPLIAFDSNRTNAAGTATKSTRDIWVIGINPSIQNAKRVTNFSGDASDNRHPSWSTDKIDSPTGAQQFVNGQQLIAFASSRIDPANDGNATGVNPNGTHDIYWLKVNIITDAGNPSVFTIQTAEGGANAAFKLNTNDSQHIYDDLYPVWPQFIATYNLAYQSDRTKFDPAAEANAQNGSGPAGQPEDIFSSLLIDINAPTLVRYNDTTGDVLEVTPRLSAPGSTVTIRAKVADFETGVRAVYAQVKNPNSKYQSADGIEHKVFLNVGLPVSSTITVLGVPIEFESQRLDARNSTTYADPRYIANVSDFFAYSGQSSPADPGWLQLNFVSRDALTGVSTYEANFTTGAFASDYLIDLIVYDNAVNPFTRNAADRAQNWKIYDNLWGFSTQPFIPSKNILFVSDYSSGQKFFGSRVGTSSPTNVSHTFWGTESWLTDIDVNLLPTQALNGTTANTWVDHRNSLGVFSYFDGLLDDGNRRDGRPNVSAQAYDMWRIQCRGPVPNSVLQQYLPRTEQQPPDTVNGETNPRNVRVWDRMIFWNSPYTGNVFTGPGTIADPSVQAQLQAFLQAGGRMFINGQDIAWALTLDGATSNAFVTNALKATFVRDSADAIILNFNLGGSVPLGFIISGSRQLASAATPNPIVHEPTDVFPGYIQGRLHLYFGPPEPDGVSDFVNLDPNWLVAGNDTNNPRTIGSPGVDFPDVVTATGGAVADFTYGGGGTAMLHHDDAAGTGSRIVYSPMGIEGLFIDFYAPAGSTNLQRAKNRRMEVFHNAICWMRSGVISGTVTDLEGGQPLPGALVRLHHTGTITAPATDFTGRTAEDGTYVVGGVIPTAYEVSAIVRGYTTQKRTGVITHGGWRNEITFRMTKAEPAAIKGKITRVDGTTPVVGATISAVDINDPNSPTFTAISDANGEYLLDRIPSQTVYRLTVAATGFGESIPLNRLCPNANDPIQTQRDTVVQAAKTYLGFDFQLKAEQGSATGRVLNNANGNAISGATVTATFAGQTVTAVTDGAGNYSFNKNNSPANGLDPGQWSFIATAPGFAPNNPAVSVSVVSNTNTAAADIRLDAIAPGSLSGYVTRSTDGVGVQNVLIEVKDANGALIASMNTGADVTAAGDTTNYKFNNLPAGVTYTVTATINGFTPRPTSRQAAVASGVETKDIDFTLDPLHVFPGALSMVSAPYDYNAFDVGDLLSIPTQNRANGTFRFGRWELQSYAFYPNPAATTFRLGKGYFIANTPSGTPTNLALSTTGVTADDTRPFNVSLNAGWNMVGNPFPFTIDWTRVKVLDNGVLKSHEQAIAEGAISSVIFGFVSGTYVLDFRLEPWLGYWVRAHRNVTLVIDPTTDAVGRAAPRNGASRAAMGAGSGWSLNLHAQVGGTRDESTMIGMNSRATDGADAYKAEKPPVVDGAFTRVAIEHNDWAARSGEYGVDLRSSSPTEKVWTFNVTSNVPNEKAVITWPNAAESGRRVRMTLTDLGTGQVRDLRSSSSYSWQTGEGITTRKFKIQAVPETSISRLVISNLSTRQVSRSSGVNVSYTINAPADVEMRILSNTGRAVRTVMTRASRAAGSHQATWDLKDDRGVSLPAGSYLLEVKGNNSDGQSAKAVTTVLAVR